MAPGPTLLCLVAQSTSLVGSGWPRSAMEVGQLAILPASHTEEEAKYIRLLLAPQLLHILICAHLVLSVERIHFRKTHMALSNWTHCRHAGLRVPSMDINV